MRLVPEQQNARLTAVLLLVVALIMIYLLGFHWFVKRHAAYAGELNDLEEQLGRFEAVAAQSEPLQAQLAVIRESRDDADLFLAGDDISEAGAAMGERLKQIVAAEAEGDCLIRSTTPTRPGVQERFRRVTVDVRMRCEGEDLLRVQYRLESEVPMVLVESININRPRNRRRRAGGEVVEVARPLEIQFEMSGYLQN